MLSYDRCHLALSNGDSLRLVDKITMHRATFFWCDARNYELYNLTNVSNVKPALRNSNGKLLRRFINISGGNGGS